MYEMAEQQPPNPRITLRLADKQARGLILGNQASNGRACLLACLFIACI